MINYIGNFNDIEKEYIEKFLHNSIVIKQDPYFPLFSIEEVIEYVNIKLKDTSLKLYRFNNKKLFEIVTPAVFTSSILNNINNDKLVSSKDSIVYIQQGCSEDCICTSAYKCKFSVPFEDIKNQIINLPQNNIISLYGINVGDYNYNTMNIIDLCKKLLKEFLSPRLVLCNISPYSPILKELVQYIKSESRIIPILYMCVNSGSQKILNIEGHKNIENDLNKLLKDTNIKIIPYLIVGSPEETEEDFNLTINWVKEHKDILLGAIILPYTANGIGNCNQTISSEELIKRLAKLNEVILNNDINNINIPISLLRNIVETSICGEDHKFYERYKL